MRLKGLQVLSAPERFVAETVAQARLDLREALGRGDYKDAALICRGLRESGLISQVIGQETIEVIIKKEYAAMVTEETRAKVLEYAEQCPGAKPSEISAMLKEQGIDISRQAITPILRPDIKTGRKSPKPKKPEEKKPKELRKPEEKVDHPAWYQSGKIEAIDVITAFGLDFCLGNAVKYILRAGRKNPDTFNEDLEKAIWYLERSKK